MKTGKSIQQLADEIERQNASKQDARVLSTALSTHTDTETGVTTLGFGEGKRRASFNMLHLAHRQLSDLVGMPQRWYDHLREQHNTLRVYDEKGVDTGSLFDMDMDVLLSQRPQDERRLVRTLDGNARAVLSNNFRPIDHLPILVNVLPVLMDTPGINWAEASLEVTDTRMYLKLVNERMTQDIRVGDAVQAGVVITNSEVGLGAFRVQPLLYRLACLNGMIRSDDSVAKYHVGGALGELEDGSAYEWLQDDTINARNDATIREMRDVVRSALNDVVFNRAVERAREAEGIKIKGDPIAAVEWISTKFQLGQDEQAGVLRNLIEGGSLSLWGLTNAVTAYAQDEAVDFDRSTELETIGGRVLALPAPEVTHLINLERREPQPVAARRASRRREAR
jgi:hypothetical protein